MRLVGFRRSGSQDLVQLRIDPDLLQVGDGRVRVLHQLYHGGHDSIVLTDPLVELVFKLSHESDLVDLWRLLEPPLRLLVAHAAAESVV